MLKPSISKTQFTLLSAALTVLAALLLSFSVGSASAGATAAPKTLAPAYEHYVGCYKHGLSFQIDYKIISEAKPATQCKKSQGKAAFFRSNVGNGDPDIFPAYTVCFKFPSGKNLCTQSLYYSTGTLYINKIPDTILGKVTVTWFVKDNKYKKVGSSVFRVVKG